MNEARFGEQLANLREVQRVRRRLLDEHDARREASDQRLEELRRVVAHEGEELALGEIAREANAAAAARVGIELPAPRAQLRANVRVEDVRLLAGPHEGMRRDQALQPGG